MSYQKHNFEPGAVLFASQLNDIDNQIEFLSNQGSSFSDNFKTALLNCFENVAWINENGQTYYDALYDSLYPDNTWFITNILTGCTTSNNATSIFKNNSYVATITANQGYTLNGATVSITMGGNDVTNLYYSSGSINIPNVTGNLVITVTATSAVVSISAVFTQGQNVIYNTDNLNKLRQYLVVTATYVDSTTATVMDYTLDGTLEVGTSTITVSYGGKTDTFSVIVTEYVGKLGYVDDGLLMLLDGIANGENGAHNTTVSTLYDQSGNDKNWTIDQGTVTATDKALVFSSSCFRKLYSGKLATPKTIEVVLEPNNVMTDYQCISCGLASGGSSGTTKYGTTSIYNGYILNYTGGTYGCLPLSSGIHTYTFVDENGTWQGYIDGIPTSFGTVATTWRTSTERLGSFRNASDTQNQYFFGGKLYSFRYYTISLTSSEVSINRENDVNRFSS